MENEVKRLCEIKSLHQLHSMQRENEAAKEAAAGRVKSVSLKVMSLGDVVLLLVKRYAPASMRSITELIHHFFKQ